MARQILVTCDPPRVTGASICHGRTAPVVILRLSEVYIEQSLVQLATNSDAETCHFSHRYSNGLQGNATSSHPSSTSDVFARLFWSKTAEITIVGLQVCTPCQFISPLRGQTIASGFGEDVFCERDRQWTGVWHPITVNTVVR